MVGSPESKHSEWDLMYAAGLKVRESSDLCHQNVSTLHLHFKVQAEHDAETKARHDAALAARNPDRPSVLWRRRLSEVLAFHTLHNRLPGNSSDTTEAGLHRWLCLQRRAFDPGLMWPAKITLMDQLPGWRTDTHKENLDQGWRQRVLQLQRFVGDRGTMPRYKTYADEAERALGVRLHVQHQRRAEGLLLHWRLEALDAAVPGWRSRV